jgi:hypothetical protein
MGMTLAGFRHLLKNLIVTFAVGESRRTNHEVEEVKEKDQAT